MKLKNSIKIMTVLMLSIFLIVGSIGSIAEATKNQEDRTVKNGMVLKTKAVKNTINFDNTALCINEITMLDSIDEDVIISNDTAEERYPAIAQNGKNAVVAYEYDDGGETEIYLKSSTNYGETWSSSYNINLGGDYDNFDVLAPCLDVKPGSNKAYGGVISSIRNSAAYGYFEISDISSSLSFVTVTTLDWSNVSYNSSSGEFFSFWGFSDTNILNYDNSTTPWVMAFIGSTNYTDDEGEGLCTDTVMFSFNDLDYPDNYVSIAWFPEIEHCSNLDIAHDFDSETIYGICEIENNSNQDLLFFKGNPTNWYNDDDLMNQTITSNENLLNPQIKVSGDNIYIVAETDTKGIILYYSSDDGENWVVKNVTSDILPPSTNPAYPNIGIKGTDLFCTFIESGNISIVNSSDNGGNWSDLETINDVNNSVVSQYNYYDITNIRQIVWTDNRGGNKDIYFHLGYLPTVDFTVTNFSFSKGNPLSPANNVMSITVKNLGEDYAENVRVDVIYRTDDGTNTTLTTTIPRINGYQSKTIFVTLFEFKLQELIQGFIDFAGIQNITVTVDPNQVKEDTNYDNNELTEDVEYKDIFVRFWRLENIFKILK